MAWKIKTTDLDKLWTEIYPRILAEIWSSSEAIDEERFINDAPYRIENVIRDIYELDLGYTNMDITILDTVRRFDFRLTNEGLVLPWPEQPTRPNKVWKKYLMSRGNIRMPALVIAPPGPPAQPPAKPLWRLRGRTYRQVIQLLPKLTAAAWLAREENPDFITDTRQVIHEHLENADALDALYKRDATGVVRGGITFNTNALRPDADDRDDAYVHHGYVTTEQGDELGGLDFPFRYPPPEMDEIYRAWAEGKATNTTITYTPTSA